MNDNVPAASNQTCTTSGFNYCKFSKTIVAVPAFTLIAFIVYSLTDNPVMRIVGAVAAIVAAYYIAVWLDRVPFLQRKFKGIGACKRS